MIWILTCTVFPKVSKMQDRIKINSYLDFYESLLTDKQRQICSMYYREDLSLQEIADIEGTSRAAVHDLLKRTKNELSRFESHLHMLESYRKRMQYYTQIMEAGNSEINNLIQKCIDTEGGSYE